MSISYSRPLTIGFYRMKKALFQPFDITKWFKVGFTAWLAGLTDCRGSSGNSSNNYNSDWNKFFDFPQTAWEWLIDNPLWFNLIIVGIVFLIIVTSIIIWVSSRGKFMFLHNVALDKSDISLPWHEYKKEGNSLFIWQFFFGWFAFAVFILFLVNCFLTSKNLYLGDFPGIAIFWSIAAMVLMLIGYIVIFGYISLFLKDFVVPIMYKRRVGILRGWSIFLALFFRRFFSFVLYGLFIFILGIAVVLAVILFSVMTCCIGLLLIAIPYIGAIILLPISYTFRAFSIAFLAQFGEEFNVFPSTDLEISE